MDAVIVGVIIAVALIYCVKKVYDKIRPDAPVCGSGCSCGSSPQNCPAMKIENRLNNAVFVNVVFMAFPLGRLLPFLIESIYASFSSFSSWRNSGGV